jgi:hypothetical protein
MGMSIKAVLVMSVALIALNYLRGFADAQTWMPDMLKRAPGIGLDDVLDGAILVGVLFMIHKAV